jgi:hypothetical protein
MDKETVRDNVWLWSYRDDISRKSVQKMAREYMKRKWHEMRGKSIQGVDKVRKEEKT